MEATFVIKSEEDANRFLERFKQLFAGKEVTVEVKEVASHRADVQRQLFRRMQETQKKYPPKPIDPEIDITKLIDEMYWEGNH